MSCQFSLSVILPALNEEDNIENVVLSAVKYLNHTPAVRDFEIIVVDDGSTDRTFDVLQQLQKTTDSLHLVTHSKNLGYGCAMSAGIRQARGEWLLLMDADGQFQINSFEDMIKFLPDYDIVIGYRMRRQDPLYRIILGNLNTYLSCVLFSLQVKDINCGFKLFRRDVLMSQSMDGHAGAFYAGILKGAFARNYRIKQIPVMHYPRIYGRQTGASPRVIMQAMADVLRLKFSRYK